MGPSVEDILKLRKVLRRELTMLTSSYYKSIYHRVSEQRVSFSASTRTSLMEAIWGEVVHLRKLLWEVVNYNVSRFRMADRKGEIATSIVNRATLITARVKGLAGDINDRVLYQILSCAGNEMVRSVIQFMASLEQDNLFGEGLNVEGFLELRRRRYPYVDDESDSDGENDFTDGKSSQVNRAGVCLELSPWSFPD